MSERKEIKIDKKKTRNYVSDFLKFLVIAGIIITGIQHFGEFGGSCEKRTKWFNPYDSIGNNCDNDISFSSPLSKKEYLGFEPIRINGFFKEGKYQTSQELKELNYSTKLLNYYLPSTFLDNWLKLLILTIILYGLSQLKSKLSRKYKLTFE
tara:strand:+ start:125 stop:580 length:456 start_codon:yes stop_codon:yes gene_type:complete